MTMKVKPNPAREVEGKPLGVLDPSTGEFIPAEGKNVPTTPYWLRRLADGDVVRVEDEAGNAGQISHAQTAAELPASGAASAVKRTNAGKPKRGKAQATEA